MSAVAKKSENTEIRPFRVNFPETELVEMRKRIKATRWPDRELVKDSSQGVQLATIQKLARYWLNDYDWRKCEARLNALPQFITEIDGVDIHFIHVVSKHENAVPIILCHGWPGSIIELLKLVEPLTNPEAHGATASDAFHVVIPSMPGYGFSGKPTEKGWNQAKIASAYVELMKRLGYDKFVAQGGDWGALVIEEMALQAPPELLAIHSNMPGAVPPDVDAAAQAGKPVPSSLAGDERHAYEQMLVTYKHVAYGALMQTRPQTLVALSDSPVGLASFLIDHDIWSYELIARVFDDHKEGLTKEDILDNITLYWLTNTALSAARLYAENTKGYLVRKDVKKVPVAVSAFPEELYQCPRSWAEQAFPKLLYFNKVDKGGHFAAWEQPQRFVDELRAAFKSLRKS